MKKLRLFFILITLVTLFSSCSSVKSGDLNIPAKADTVVTNKKHVREEENKV